MRVHLKFMVLCVACAFNWFIQAYRMVRAVCNKRILLATSKNLGRSISGMLSSMMKSNSQLNMMSVCNHLFFSRISVLLLNNVYFLNIFSYAKVRFTPRIMEIKELKKIIVIWRRHFRQKQQLKVL